MNSTLHLTLKALPCKRFELCDDLGGLTFKTVTYSNSEDSRVVDIDFISSQKKRIHIFIKWSYVINHFLRV